MCKKFVLMILLLSCLAFASYQARVGANTLNVRMSGSTSSKVIAKLKKGDEVTVYLCQNGFCEVSFENGSGFVSEKFISQIEESSSHENEITSEDIANIKMFLIILGILTILATMLVFGLSKYNAKLSLVAFLLMLAINIWGIVSYNILFIGLDIVAGIIGFFLGFALASQNEGRSSSEGGSFWDSSDDDRAKERREERRRVREDCKRREQEEREYRDRLKKEEREREREEREREKKEREREKRERLQEEQRKANERKLQISYVQGNSIVCIDGTGYKKTFQKPQGEVVGYSATSITIKRNNRAYVYVIKNNRLTFSTNY